MVIERSSGGEGDEIGGKCGGVAAADGAGEDDFKILWTKGKKYSTEE